MMHRAWNSIEAVPYFFKVIRQISRLHWQKNSDSTCAFPDGNSSSSSPPMAKKVIHTAWSNTGANQLLGLTALCFSNVRHHVPTLLIRAVAVSHIHADFGLQLTEPNKISKWFVVLRHDIPELDLCLEIRLILHHEECLCPLCLMELLLLGVEDQCCLELKEHIPPLKTYYWTSHITGITKYYIQVHS